MAGPSLKSEFQDFLEFATRQIEQCDAGGTVEDLVQQWRGGSEYAQTVADVRRGLAEDADGRAEPMAEAFADVRRQLGIAQ